MISARQTLDTPLYSLKHTRASDLKVFWTWNQIKHSSHILRACVWQCWNMKEHHVWNHRRCDESSACPAESGDDPEISTEKLESKGEWNCRSCSQVTAAEWCRTLRHLTAAADEECVWGGLREVFSCAAVGLLGFGVDVAHLWTLMGKTAGPESKHTSVNHDVCLFCKSEFHGFKDRVSTGGLRKY